MHKENNVKKFIQLSIIVGIIFGMGSFSNMLAQNAADLTYMTEEYPPFNYSKNGKLMGVAVDLLRAIWLEMGVPEQEILVFPWARAYKMAQTKPGTVLFSTTRNPEREHLFKWVGPIKSNPIGLIAKKDRHIKIDSFRDAKNYKIGTIREDYSETALANKGFDLDSFERTAKLISNIKKLDIGRIDLLVNNVEGTFHTIEANGLNRDNYECV